MQSKFKVGELVKADPHSECFLPLSKRQIRGKLGLFMGYNDPASAPHLAFGVWARVLFGSNEYLISSEGLEKVQ